MEGGYFIIHSHHIFLVTKESVALDFGLEEIDFSLESIKRYDRGDIATGKKSERQWKQEKETRSIEENGE